MMLYHLFGKYDAPLILNCSLIILAGKRMSYGHLNCSLIIIHRQGYLWSDNVWCRTITQFSCHIYRLKVWVRYHKWGSNKLFSHTLTELEARAFLAWPIACHQWWLKVKFDNEFGVVMEPLAWRHYGWLWSNFFFNSQLLRCPLCCIWIQEVISLN